MDDGDWSPSKGCLDFLDRTTTSYGSHDLQVQLHRSLELYRYIGEHLDILFFDTHKVIYILTGGSQLYLRYTPTASLYFSLSPTGQLLRTGPTTDKTKK